MLVHPLGAGQMAVIGLFGEGRFVGGVDMQNGLRHLAPITPFRCGIHVD
ncbi:hypothetical protein ACVWZK_008566 [Bradyrhizobium sp. GM0.4]